jgi:hypothetical protein
LNNDSNSHYQEDLKELKERGQKLAGQYIPKIYNILRYEEKLAAEDCRAKIEHDCVDNGRGHTIHIVKQRI